MTSWPYTQITTHADDIKDRLTSQYDKAVLLQGLLEVWGERVQGLEDAAWTVLTEKWLDVAVGSQLDEIGGVIGEPRLGRTDTQYRDAIGLRITINQSGGEPERIIEYLIRVLGADSVIYSELYPAKIEVFVEGTVDWNTIDRVRSIVPAGVGSVFISSTDGETPFGTKELNGTAATDIDGFGELNDPDGGELAELIEV